MKKYVKLPAGALCNDDTRIDEIVECEKAAKNFGGCLGNGEEIVVGIWDDVPKGCFIKTIGTSVIYLNKHESGQGGKGEYSTICRRSKGGVYDSYTQTTVGTTNSCPTGAALTKDECRTAGKDLGGKLGADGNPIEEYNNAAPTGCYQNLNPGYDNKVYYNLNKIGRGQLGLTSICRKVPYKSGSFTMTRVSADIAPVCQSGDTSLSEEECIKAGLAFGGYLRNGGLTVGDYTDTPTGCFLNPSEDNAIHYNNRTDVTQVNGGDGRYSILCAKPVTVSIF